MEILGKVSHCIYHIIDKRSGYVISTFLANSEMEAQRSFEQELKNEKSLLSQYPDDYTLVFDGKVIHTTYIEEMQVKTTTEVLDVVACQK